MFIVTEWVQDNAAWLCLIGVLGLFVLFVSERFAPEIAAILAVAVFLLTGLLDTGDMIGAFANSAPITIACMFILSAALVRTGALVRATGLIRRSAPAHPRLTVIGVIGLVIAASAFMNNTPVVMIMIPVVVALSREVGTAPSRLLIPLSYAAILGGTCTLIGTSTNLLVDGVARNAGLAPFHIFEITGIGLCIALAGGIYMGVFGPLLLPSRSSLSDRLIKSEPQRFLTDATIAAGSPLIGRTRRELHFLDDRNLILRDVVRRGESLREHLDEVTLRAGDHLILESEISEVLSLRREGAVTFGREGLSDLHQKDAIVVEALVSPGAAISAEPLKAFRLRRRFGVYVLAIHRHGSDLKERIGRIQLQPGDTVLMEGAAEDITRMSGEMGLINITEPSQQPYRRDKALIAAGVIAAVAGLAAFDIMPIAGLAVIGVAVVMLTNCLDPREAFDAIDWPILTLILSMLAIGAALESAGSIAALVSVLEPWLALAPPILLLATIYLITSVLTEVVTNNAVAVVVTPVAIALAVSAGLDPRPFVVAVMMGASASFATPIGYQTNTLVYGPGNYRFSDFVRIGVPMNILMLIVTVGLVPLFWPLEG